MFVLLLYFGHLCFVLILYIHFKDFYLFRAFFFEFVFIIPSYKCVFSRIFEFWCIEQRSYAEKGQAVLNSVIISIQNMGFASVLVYIIGYICKKIATYWVKNNRTKNAVLKNQYKCLTTMEIITLKPPFFPQQMATSNNRGRPKIDFAESSKRTK